MHFDRLDICEAYFLVEVDYNVGGWLSERQSNKRRMEATHVQLYRLGFKPSPMLTYDKLTDNGKEIYNSLVARYGFRV